MASEKLGFDDLPAAGSAEVAAAKKALEDPNDCEDLKAEFKKVILLYRQVEGNPADEKAEIYFTLRRPSHQHLSEASYP